MQVEHEADEGTLKARARAHIHGEASAGEFGGAFEVEDAELFANLPVRLGREGEGGNFAPGFYRDVVGIRAASGDLIAGQVGDAGERETKLLVKLGSGLVELVQLFLEEAGLFHQRRCILPGFLQSADLLAQLIATSFGLLG